MEVKPVKTYTWGNETIRKDENKPIDENKAIKHMPGTEIRIKV